jgi:hypothetical protein
MGAGMNSKLPIEGQKIEVKLKDGDWQEAVYRDDKFEDLYGLPLMFDRIEEWRPSGSRGRASTPGRGQVAASNYGNHRVG